MTYQPLHRKPSKPRWHDRPRAWLAATLDRMCGREEWNETDDHGNHIGDLFERDRCETCYQPYEWQPDDEPELWDPDEPQVIRTTQVAGVHLPLSGGHVNPWVNCAFAKEVMPLEQRRSSAADGVSGALVDVPRPESRLPRESGSVVVTGLGPGYRQNVPWPGPTVSAAEGAKPVNAPGPGHLSMFDITPVRGPWPPRTWPAILSGPRIRPELRAALLAEAAA